MGWAAIMKAIGAFLQGGVAADQAGQAAGAQQFAHGAPPAQPAPDTKPDAPASAGISLPIQGMGLLGNGITPPAPAPDLTKQGLLSAYRDPNGPNTPPLLPALRDPNGPNTPPLLPAVSAPAATPDSAAPPVSFWQRPETKKKALGLLGSMLGGASGY
jgi:hypothetical protein